MVVTIDPGFRVTMEIRQSVEKNASTVCLTGVELRNPQGSYVDSCWVLGEIRLGGSLAANLILSNTQACALDYCGAWRGGGLGSWSGYSAREVELRHREDGTVEAVLTASLRLYTTSQRHLADFRFTGTVSLPAIPRASALTVRGSQLGQPVTVQLSRASASFCDTVSWQCGEAHGVLAEKTGETALSWVPPLSLAAQQTQGTALTVTVAAETFCGETAVGTSTAAVELQLPAEIVPSLTVAVEDVRGYFQKHGGYVQGQSQVQVKTAAQGAYGASIRQIAVQCGSLAGSGEVCCFVPADSGEVNIIVTVTDSRGRTARQEQKISVLPYELPQAEITAAFRCTQDGTAKPDGDYLCLQFEARVTPIQGGSAAYRAVCREHGGEGSRSVLLTDYGDKTSVQGAAVLPAGVDCSYACTVSVTDSFVTVSSRSALVPVAFALLDFSRQERSVGIGMRARRGQTLSLGLEMDMTEHGIHGLSDPAAPQDAATKAYVDALVQAALSRLKE